MIINQIPNLKLNSRKVLTESKESKFNTSNKAKKYIKDANSLITKNIQISVKGKDN